MIYIFESLYNYGQMLANSGAVYLTRILTISSYIDIAIKQVCLGRVKHGFEKATYQQL